MFAGHLSDIEIDKDSRSVRGCGAWQGGIMKIGDVGRIYSTQPDELRLKRQELLKLQKEQEKNGGAHITDAEWEGVILELSALQKEYDATQKRMDKLTEYSVAMQNAEAAKQQGDAMEEAADEMAKCMEIARRLADGDKVPAFDEKKLMEYNFKLYMAAKNAGSLKQNQKRKEYKSLWTEEDEAPQEVPDIREKVDEMTAPSDLDVYIQQE